MKTRPLAIVILSCSLSIAVFSQETLVPLDNDGKIEKIDTELEIKLQLFQDVKNFRQALLFRLPDSSFVLEVWYQDNGRTMKTRQSLSQTDAESLRAGISKALLLRAPAAGLNQEGRSKFVANLYGLGLGLYGWGIPYVIGIEDGTAFLGMYLLIGGGSIFVAHGSTENMEISLESANLFMYGTALGISHGLFVHAMIYDNEATAKGYVASAMIGAATEGITGFVLARRLKLTPGSVEMIGTTSGFGILYGVGSSYIGDLTAKRSIATAMLVGSVAGTLSGALLAHSQSYTNGDVAVFRTSGILGAYLPVAALKAFQNENNKDYVTGAMVGGVVGSVIGHLLVVDKDFATEDGGFVSLGTFGGWLLGWGFASLAKLDSRASFPIGGATALLGFVSMYRSYAPSAKARAEQTSWNFSIHPEGLLAMTQQKSLFLQNRTVVPIARLEYRF